MIETTTDTAPAPARRISGSNTRQRTVSIAVRFTAEEAAKLQAAAERAGLPAGAYLRKAALGRTGPRTARRAPSVDQVALAQVLAQLGRVGGNVNQLAKAFNTDGTSPARSEWEPVKADIAAMADALMKALAPPAGDHQRR